MRRIRVSLTLVVAMLAWFGPGVAATAADGPTLTVSPSTDLVDGQSVHGIATGFTPGSPIGMIQCPAGSTNPDNCPGFLSAKPADPSGDVEFDLALTRTMPSSAGVIDCAVVGACVVLVFNFADSSYATAPIAFDPNIAPPPSLLVGLLVDQAGGSAPIAADGSVTITGTITCSVDATVLLSAAVRSPSGQADGRVDAQPCGPVATPWAVTAGSSGGSGLQPGPADLEVTAAPPGGGDPLAAVVAGITLTRAARDTDTYYLALGDSLVTGFAAPPGQGYVDDLLAYYRQQDPNLRLVNYGCSSEVSAGLIANGLCSFDGGRSQLEAAEAFIAAHPGRVKLITIDIGGNDVVFCGVRPVDEQGPCLNDALAVLDANMATILGRLRTAAGPQVPILGMNYFNPFLNHWLGDDSDKAFAHLTTAGLDAVNQHLEASYAAYGVPVADVAGAFHVDDYDTLVDSPYGTIPINVALACRWLDIGCVAGGVGSFGDDANAEGYQVIAAEFIKLLPVLEPGSPPPSGPPRPEVPTSGAGTGSAAEPVPAVPAFTG